jgi:hypothetical protein
MNRAMASLLLFWVLGSMCAHAEDAKVMHRDWAIMLTITDLATGARLERLELDSELRFDGPNECKSIVAKVGRMPASDHFAAILTCRKVRPGPKPVDTIPVDGGSKL